MSMYYIHLYIQCIIFALCVLFCLTVPNLIYVPFRKWQNSCYCSKLDKNILCISLWEYFHLKRWKINENRAIFTMAKDAIFISFHNLRPLVFQKLHIPKSMLLCVHYRHWSLFCYFLKELLYNQEIFHFLVLERRSSKALTKYRDT